MDFWQPAAHAHASMRAFPHGACRPPACLQTPSHTGALPLQATLKYRSSEAIVSAVLAACPEAATEPDAKGDLAIHSVLRLKFDPPIILSILRSYPEVATMRAGDRNLPFHLALTNGATEEVLARLLTIYADATMEEDKDGVLPLERAIQRKCLPEVTAPPLPFPCGRCLPFLAVPCRYRGPHPEPQSNAAWIVPRRVSYGTPGLLTM